RGAVRHEQGGDVLRPERLSRERGHGGAVDPARDPDHDTTVPGFGGFLAQERDKHAADERLVDAQRARVVRIGPDGADAFARQRHQSAKPRARARCETTRSARSSRTSGLRSRSRPTRSRSISAMSRCSSKSGARATTVPSGATTSEPPQNAMPSSCPTRFTKTTYSV